MDTVLVLWKQTNQNHMIFIPLFYSTEKKKKKSFAGVLVVSCQLITYYNVL